MQLSTAIYNEMFSAIGGLPGRLIALWSKGRPQFAAHYNWLDDQILDPSSSSDDIILHLVAHVHYDYEEFTPYFLRQIDEHKRRFVGLLWLNR